MTNVCLCFFHPSCYCTAGTLSYDITPAEYHYYTVCLSTYIPRTVQSAYKMKYALLYQNSSQNLKNNVAQSNKYKLNKLRQV